MDNSSTVTPIEQAIAVAGSAAALAQLLEVSDAAVGQWKSGERRVPEERCPAIEQFTGVTVEALRPDALWVRVKDKQWPTKLGRPLLDIGARRRPSKQKAEAA